MDDPLCVSQENCVYVSSIGNLDFYNFMTKVSTTVLLNINKFYNTNLTAKIWNINLFQKKGEVDTCVYNIINPKNTPSID